MTKLASQVAYETLRYNYDLLTPEQRQKLVNTIATNYQWVYFAVRDCYELLTTEQRQQLIDAVAPDEFWSRHIMQDCYDLLTPEQVKQLSRERVVITNDFRNWRNND